MSLFFLDPPTDEHKTFSDANWILLEYVVSRIPKIAFEHEIPLVYFGFVTTCFFGSNVTFSISTLDGTYAFSNYSLYTYVNKSGHAVAILATIDGGIASIPGADKFFALAAFTISSAENGSLWRG